MREKNDIKVFGWIGFKHPKFDLPGHRTGFFKRPKGARLDNQRRIEEVA